MYYRLKVLGKLFMPPIFVRGVSALFNASREALVNDGERGPGWYDRAFLISSGKHRPYYEARLYFLWSIVAYLIARDGIKSVLEVGCGSGRLSQLFRDSGVEKYCGIDFSLKRIEWARKNCPDFTFVHADVFETDVFETFDYDAVVCGEFLEHIERDIDVIARVRSGARFYGTVPNFPYTSHVRYFKDRAEVSERYSKYFRNFMVTSFLADKNGRTYFLLEGIKV